MARVAGIAGEQLRLGQRRRRSHTGERPGHHRTQGRPGSLQEIRCPQAVDATEELKRPLRHSGDRLRLQVEHVPVELGWPAHRLAGVVHDVVEACVASVDVLAERLDAGRVPQVEPVHLQPVDPVPGVGLLGVAAGGIPGKPGGDDQGGAGPEQLDAGLVADLDPSAGEQRHLAREVGGFGALGEVEGCAGGAQLVVEVVDCEVALLADVAVPVLPERRSLGIGDVSLFEVLGDEHVGGHEHGPGAQASDPRVGQHRLVALHLVRPFAPPAGLGLLPSGLDVGIEGVPGCVEEPQPLLGGEGVEERPVGGDELEELGRRHQAVGQVGVVTHSPRMTTRAGGRTSAAEKTSDVGGLAGVLEAVRDEAGQTDAEGHRRIPVLVDHPLEVVLSETAEVGDRPVVDGIVVADEVGSRPSHAGHVVCRVAVAVVLRVRSPSEALVPTVGQVALLLAGGLGDVVVLHPGEVPDEPGDGVGPVAGRGGELALIQVVHGRAHDVGQAPIELDEVAADIHGRLLLKATDAP